MNPPNIPFLLSGIYAMDRDKGTDLFLYVNVRYWPKADIGTHEIQQFPNVRLPELHTHT
jgi:hypothetical protein